MEVIIDPTSWTRALAGGVLIGLAASILLLLNGRIAGISGILGGLLYDRQPGDLRWRFRFVLGLLIGAALVATWRSDLLPGAPTVGWGLLITAGLLVGFGTRLGSGCTSGHGICGIARISRRSLVATATFMAFGFITVFIVRHVLELPMKALVPMLAGILFGAGLALGGMTQPAKVIGFLDLAGAWDPSLAFVMGGGLLITVPMFALARRRKQPLFEDRFYWPTRQDIDGRLITGAALFGIGWGLGGYCPGPALASLSAAQLPAAVFCVAMIAGMGLERLLSRRK